VEKCRVTDSKSFHVDSGTVVWAISSPEGRNPDYCHYSGEIECGKLSFQERMVSIRHIFHLLNTETVDVIRQSSAGSSGNIAGFWNVLKEIIIQSTFLL
jgi:hypothetical protein